MGRKDWGGGEGLGKAAKALEPARTVGAQEGKEGESILWVHQVRQVNLVQAVLLDSTSQPSPREGVSQGSLKLLQAPVNLLQARWPLGGCQKENRNHSAPAPRARRTRILSEIALGVSPLQVTIHPLL